jgi:hypothetical protein
MSDNRENEWFRKIVGALMIASLVFGAVPFVKQWISPSAQAKR